MNITREISMKIAAPAGCIAFLLLALSSDRVSAQAGGEIQVIGGRVDGVVHDAAGKDPGARLLRRGARRHDLGRRAGGADGPDATRAAGQPRNADRLRGGTGRSADEGVGASVRMDGACRSSRRARDTHAARGRTVASSRRCRCRSIPSHHFRAAPGQADVELPTDVQIGRPATIRGRLDGTLRGKTVDVGGGMANLLASSPRQIVFRVTQTTPRRSAHSLH